MLFNRTRLALCRRRRALVWAMDAPNLLAVADGSCSRNRRYIGWHGNLHCASDPDSDVPIIVEDGNFHASTVTPCMAELASIRTALSLTKTHVERFGGGIPLRIHVFNDCHIAVEASVMLDRVDLMNKGAPHLVPLLDPIHKLKLELRDLGHTVVIRRPRKSREARLIQLADGSARRARWADLIDIDLALQQAFERCQSILDGMSSDERQVAKDWF